jgi:penicillin amidase
LFNNYVFLKNIPVRNTSRLLERSESFFFKSEQEKNQLLRKSFYDAVSVLIAKYGAEPINWQWRDLHKITFKHPLGIVPEFSSMLNTGPFKVNGNGTTVNNLEYSFASALKSGTFEAYLGPSMRFIVDMGKPDSHYSILAGGQSGQPLQENYSNQARLWINGDYKIVSNNFDDLRNESLKLFTLEPAQ